MTTRRLALTVLSILIIALASASSASADGTITWGISGLTPSLDTANGDLNDSLTPAVSNNAACPAGISCSPEVNPLSGTNPILPAPSSGENLDDAYHPAEDLAVWTNGLTAPAGGQIVQVNITGCALEDTKSPTQFSQGVAVNTAVIQSLSPSGSDYDFNAISQGFTVPFCSNAVNDDSVTPSTVTTFAPTHMCVNAGDVVAFHDIGGFVDQGGAFYPEGVPMEVLAPAAGQSTDSFVGVGTDTYGADITPNAAGAGFATEADQEVTMQIVETTGDDAYQLCQGGFANEPSTSSNAINCDWHDTGDGTKAPNPTAYPDYPFCSSSGQPIPGSNVASAAPSTSNAVQSASGTGPAAKSAVAPVLSDLKLNPPLFVARRGTTLTYHDDEPGLTTLTFYRVVDTHDVLVRTVHHQDRYNAAYDIRGLGPGHYLVTATSVYEARQSAPLSAVFRVILTRRHHSGRPGTARSSRRTR